MDKNIIIADTLTTNNIRCPELIVYETIEIRNENVVHYENSSTVCFVPIKLAISYKITDAKQNLDDLRTEKLNISYTKNHIKTLKTIIKFTDKFNQTFKDENLRYLSLLDGCSEERCIAQESYARHLKNAENILQEQVKNYKTKKKNINKNCLEAVSLLLKNNGLKNHKDSAFIILRENGLDIKTHL